MEIVWGPDDKGVLHLTVALDGAAPGMALGRCGTCRVMHDIGHALTRRRLFGDQFWDRMCQYERIEREGDVVWLCIPHSVWWAESQAGIPAGKEQAWLFASRSKR